MTEKEMKRLVSRIRRFMDQEETSETERVGIALDMGEAVRKLRKATPDRWYEFLEQIEMDKKIANRMKRIGEWVYAHEATIRGLVDKLPADKVKLESLVRLKTDEKILEVVTNIDLRAKDRGEVAKAVAKVVGAPSRPPVSFDEKVRRLGQAATSSFETAIRKLDLDSIAPDKRASAATEIEKSFQKILDFLRDPKVEAERDIVPFSNVADDESEDEDGAESDTLAPAPAEAAKSPSSSKPTATTPQVKAPPAKPSRAAAGTKAAVA